jgi:phosphoglycolate phosphatase
MLLDLDGTLTDPYRGISKGLLHAFGQMGYPEPTKAQLRSMIGPPFQESFPRFGVPRNEVDQTMAHYRELYGNGGLFDADVYDGIPETLSQLVDAGHELALATSKPAYLAERILDHFELKQWFTFVGGGAVDGTRHHKHEVIQHVLQSVRGNHTPNSNTQNSNTQNKAEIVMVGDRSFDIEGARVHNLPCISVRWGYAEPGELEMLNAEAIIDSPHELPQAIQAFSAL